MKKIRNSDGKKEKETNLPLKLFHNFNIHSIHDLNENSMLLK